MVAVSTVVFDGLDLAQGARILSGLGVAEVEGRGDEEADVEEDRCAAAAVVVGVARRRRGTQAVSITYIMRR